MFEPERQALRKAALSAAASFALTLGAGMAVTLFLVTGGFSDSRTDLPAVIRRDTALAHFTTHDIAEPALSEPTARRTRSKALALANETNVLLLPEADVDFVVADSVDAFLSRHTRNDAAVTPDALYEAEGPEPLEGGAEAFLPPSPPGF
jgi:hypothetical protein